MHKNLTYIQTDFGVNIEEMSFSVEPLKGESFALFALTEAPLQSKTSQIAILRIYSRSRKLQNKCDVCYLCSN